MLEVQLVAMCPRPLHLKHTSEGHSDFRCPNFAHSEHGLAFASSLQSLACRQHLTPDQQTSLPCTAASAAAIWDLLRAYDMQGRAADRALQKESLT